MRKRIVFVITVFILSSVLLHCQFVDLGDDPTKIKISSSIDIIGVPDSSDLQFLCWSPKGSYFAFYSFNSQKSYIFNKNGNIFKTLNGEIIDWSEDEKKLLFLKNSYYVYDLFSSESKKIEVKAKKIQFGDNNNQLVYFNNERLADGSQQTSIFMLNIDTGIVNTLKKLPPQSYKFYIESLPSSESFKYYSMEKVFFLKPDLKSTKIRRCYDLCRLNLVSGEEKVLIMGVREVKFYSFPKGRIILQVDKIGEYCTFSFFDEFGSLIGNIIDEESLSIINKKSKFAYGQTLIIPYASIFRNGRLVFVGKATENLINEEKIGVETLIDQYIYLFNFQKSLVKIELPNPSKFVGSSPADNIFIAQVAVSSPVISPDHQRLITPARMEYRLVSLVRE